MDIGNGYFKCVYLSIDEVPKDMLEHFIVFEKSKIFQSIWSNFCDKVDEASIATFVDIYEHVWKYTIEACKNLLHKLYNKSFTYSDIECFADERSLYTHVDALYNAMRQCCIDFLSSLPDYKSQAVKNVRLYLEFARCSVQANSNTVQINAVQLCLKMKKLLRLNGNFSVVDDVNIQVSI